MLSAERAVYNDTISCSFNGREDSALLCLRWTPAGRKSGCVHPSRACLGCGRRYPFGVSSGEAYISFNEDIIYSMCIAFAEGVVTCWAGLRLAGRRERQGLFAVLRAR